MKHPGLTSLLLTLALACASTPRERSAPAEAPPPPPPLGSFKPVDGRSMVESGMGEANRLRNVRQVTLDGRRNSEAYFSPDGKQLIFHSVRGDNPFHQVFIMDVDGKNVRQVSPGRGKAVCGAFAPSRARVLFASSHADADAWPAPAALQRAKEEDRARRGGGTLGSVDREALMDLYEVDPDGKNITALTTTPGYDGEASYSRDGRFIVFTSTRDGDPELYIQDLQGGSARRLTQAAGWDGAAFFSPDGKLIVFRSYRAGDGTSDIYLINADGTGERRITALGALAWNPYFHPDGKRIVFASNHKASTQTPGQNFDLYLLDLVSGQLERVTYDNAHDTLPSFSPDGKMITWTSTRQGGISQVFVAEWVDG